MSFLKMNYYIAGMDSEFAVYSQWKSTTIEDSSEDLIDKQQGEIDTVDNRHLQDSDLLNIAQV